MLHWKIKPALLVTLVTLVALFGAHMGGGGGGHHTCGFYW